MRMNITRWKWFKGMARPKIKSLSSFTHLCHSKPELQQRRWFSVKNILNISICHTDLTYGIWRLELCIYGAFLSFLSLTDPVFIVIIWKRVAHGFIILKFTFMHLTKAICQRASSIRNIQCQIYYTTREEKKCKSRSVFIMHE